MGSDSDLPVMEASFEILRKFEELMPAKKRVFDIGAGMGRVSRDLLKREFKMVDLLEYLKLKMGTL